jgi:hypothetical protein
MEFFGPYGWLFATLGGAILLGIAIAYGMVHARRRNIRDRAVADAATREEYAEEERERKR